MTRRLLLFIASVIASTSLVNVAAADDGTPLPLWHVAGQQNDIYLLASVHLLRSSDYPLPGGLDVAYDDAEILVMELDMDDLDQVAASRIVQELAVAQQGSDLASIMGVADYARAATLADKAGVPLSALNYSEPWFAAITIEQLLLTRIGFDPALGLENHLMQRAVQDGKEILGLETLREQLEILDQLPLPVQRTLLLQTLEDGLQIESVMNDLLAAWRRGDTAALEKTVLADMRDQPELYRELVVSRNHNWVAQLEKLAKQRDDYLVVVGTLHLVGDDGVPALLRKRGFKVTQMSGPAATAP
ncbi:MAG: TraB/GumN family protein [Woeseia sp.]